MAKKFPPESQDVTEPLPGMDDPITQAKKDKLPAKERVKDARKTSSAYFKALDTMAKNPKVSKESKRNMLKNWEEAADTASKEEYAAGMKKGGSVSSASSRADGCAQRGKTKGRMV